MTTHVFLTGQDPETKAKLMETVGQAQREKILSNFSHGANCRQAGSVQEALHLGGADFTVEKFPLKAETPAVDADGAIVEGADPVRVTIPGKAGIVATWADGRGRGLGAVGETYKEIQNEEAFAAAQILMDRGEFQPLSVWMNKGGAHVGLEGLIGASDLGALATGEPDVLAHLARFETAHDGTRSTMAALYSVRLVCLNGMTALEQSARVTVRHTARADKRMEEATRVLLGLQDAAREEVAFLTKLRSRRMGKKAFVTFATELLNEVRGKLDDDAEAARAKRDEEVQAILAYFNEPAMGTYGKTALDGYNAITRWLTPRRERYEEAAEHARALASNREGHGSRVRHRAQRLLLSRTHR